MRQSLVMQENSATIATYYAWTVWVCGLVKPVKSAREADVFTVQGSTPHRRSSARWAMSRKAQDSLEREIPFDRRSRKSGAHVTPGEVLQASILGTPVYLHYSKSYTRWTSEKNIEFNYPMWGPRAGTASFSLRLPFLLLKTRSLRERAVACSDYRKYSVHNRRWSLLMPLHWAIIKKILNIQRSDEWFRHLLPGSNLRTACQSLNTASSQTNPPMTTAKELNNWATRQCRGTAHAVMARWSVTELPPKTLMYTKVPWHFEELPNPKRTTAKKIPTPLWSNKIQNHTQALECRCCRDESWREDSVRNCLRNQNNLDR